MRKGWTTVLTVGLMFGTGGCGGSSGPSEAEMLMATSEVCYSALYQGGASTEAAIEEFGDADPQIIALARELTAMAERPASEGGDHGELFRLANRLESSCDDMDERLRDLEVE